MMSSRKNSLLHPWIRAGLILFGSLLVNFTIAGEKVLLPAGEFTMGSENGMPNERPVRKLRLNSFYLDQSPVSVAEYKRFAATSHHVSSAEKFGNSAVFDMASGRWLMIAGATWQHPQGPLKTAAPTDHPVTQVSWFDALKYCTASNGRLPTEAEFEYAAKSAGRYGNPVYAFGDTVVKDGDFLVNIYTGKFPLQNTGADGYMLTAPIGKTGITPLGLTDMAGNVWEWSADWYDDKKNERTLRGGSFLCDEDVCHGYRTSARSQSTPETSLMHVGFRCAYDS